MVSHFQEKMDDFVMKAPTYLNLRLGIGSRVLYPLSLLRTTAVGKLLRSFSLVLFMADFLVHVGVVAPLSTACKLVKPMRSHPCLPSKWQHPLCESVASAHALSVRGPGQMLTRLQHCCQPALPQDGLQCSVCNGPRSRNITKIRLPHNFYSEDWQ